MAKKSQPMQQADATPEKDFFISMITRDIGLDECIMDLLDNSVDGATKQLNEDEELPDASEDDAYTDYAVTITLNAKEFTIDDDCGGIDIETAKNYAFHFGKRRDAPDTPRTIGMYGIGMKRAMFKLGRKISIVSSTATDAFRVDIDVNEWANTNEWSFNLQPTKSKERAGTRISITDLNDGAAEEFADKVFVTKLRKAIARTYSIFIQKGVKIYVNDVEVPPHQFKLREGGNFNPLHSERNDGNVTVKIWAGMAGLPPEDDTAEAKVPEAEYYGWYVLCNDRVVIAADKSDKTVWGNEGFQSWHTQYNGFMGIVAFDCDDPNELPWTTTKADIDVTSPLYRRALVDMKDATRQYIAYTTARKADLDKARTLESKTEAKPVQQIPVSAKMTLPQFTKRTDMVNIAYQKPLADVKKVAKAMGNVRMAYRSVGLKTFEYYLKNEVSE